MKESKFVKTKIVAGYLLLIAVCILSVGYVYRVAVRFSAPDRSYALLHTKRSAVNGPSTTSTRPKATGS